MLKIKSKFTKRINELRIIETEDARQLIKFNDYLVEKGIQRSLRRRHVDYLISAIKSGTFRDGDIGIAICKHLNNKKVLVNGQHQLTAVYESEQPIIALYTEYLIKNDSELAELYRTFDVNLPRTIFDLGLPEAHALNIDWPRKIISLILSAGTEIYNRRHEAKPQRIGHLNEYKLIGDKINDIFSQNGYVNQTRHMMRVPVFHAMYLILEKHPREGKVFFEMIRDGENLTKTEPAYKVRNYLMTHSVGSGRGVVKGHSVPYTEMVSKIITGWNAFYRNESTDLKYYKDSPIPKVL